MSLRVRLVLLIVVLVALVVLALSWVYLDGQVNSLSGAALERSELASQQVQNLTRNRINLRSQDYPPSPDLEAAKAMWHEIVRDDSEVTAILQQTLNAYSTLVEINIVGQDGNIWASAGWVGDGYDERLLGAMAEAGGGSLHDAAGGGDCDGAADCAAGLSGGTPGRVSTTNGCPRAFESRSAVRRAKTSAIPPGP